MSLTGPIHPWTDPFLLGSELHACCSAVVSLNATVKMPRRRDGASGNILTSAPTGCLLAAQSLVREKETWTKDYKLFSLKTSWSSYLTSLSNHESPAVKATLKVMNRIAEIQPFKASVQQRPE